jgi:deoxyribodipyrimidine photo-lyase
VDKPLDRALVWFRRDLRVDDHAALYHALRAARQVWCVFLFDQALLAPLPRTDRRVEFIHASVLELDQQLQRLGRSHGRAGTELLVLHGHAAEALPRLAAELGVQAVYANHDDDPAALQRDAQVRGRLAEHGVALHTSKDHVVFERSEVLSAAGQPYSVFTPYRKAWLQRLTPFYLTAYPVARHAQALAPWPKARPRPLLPSLDELGFAPTNLRQLALPIGALGAHELLVDFLDRIDHYHEARDFPALRGPSYLSVHLRFGTVSVRQLAREAWQRMQAGSRGAEVWLSELVWRDFYHQILHHHPHVVGHAFRREYDAVRWEHGKAADAAFEAWCQGRTGYPLVDAAMLQLLQSGYMHNRLRMVTASFLTKHLGLDWRRGEAWFALHLNDFDLAANNGGWQWAAGTGCDAQPYFRIFNPMTQSEKFDAQGRFIRRYLPQLAKLPDAAIHAPWQAAPATLAAAGVELGRDYPRPIVVHEDARQRTLARYAAVKGTKPAAAATRTPPRRP